MHKNQIYRTLHNLELRFFWLLACTAGVLLAGYLYFVSSSIVNVIVRQELEQTIAQTHSELSVLETQYLKAKESLNMAYAQSLGFHAIQEKTFVAKKSLFGTALSFNNEI